MYTPDIRTIFIGFSISNAICAFVMAFLWLQNRSRFAGLGFWLANIIMQFLAVLLMALRGIIPDFVSILVANIMVVGGLMLFYAGLERFAGKATSQVHNYILLAAFSLIHAYYAYWQPNLAARNHNFSTAVILVCIQVAGLAIYRIDARFQPHALRVGLIFVAFGLVNILRIFLDVSLPTTRDLFQSGLFGAVAILTFQMLSIALTFSLFLLVNHRLVADLEQDITERRLMELSAQQRLMELEIVNKLSISLRAGRNLGELLHILLQETLKAVSAVDGCILLLEAARPSLKMAESRGWFEAVPEISLSVPESAVGRVISTNQPYVSLDLRNDLPDRDQMVNFVPQQCSGAFLPVSGENGMIGAILVSFPLPRRICDNELRLLVIISQLAGNAITRCRLHDQVKFFNSGLQNEIEQKIVIQELLAAEKELLSTTLMSIADGVIVTDDDGVVILFNQAAEFITGYASSEAIQKPVSSVFNLCVPNPLESARDVIDYLLKVENTQKNFTKYQAPLILSKAGEKILLSGSITPLKSSEKYSGGFVIVFQNINEKQKAEAQKALSQKMEAIGQLAAGIAHEINTPIQYIGDNIKFLGKAYSRYSETLAAYRQMMKERLERSVTQEDLDRMDELARQKRVFFYADEVPQAIQESIDGTERVRKIVLAMREFSHPSEKEKKLADINHGIESTIVISRNEWKYCADVETDLSADLPLVDCQIDEINQVMLNLIVNAAHAIQEKASQGSDQKGKILISTIRQADKVLIKVQDTGTGIPFEIRERIFDPFFTTKGVGKGTGQGLSMAHNIIVKKHRGSISVDSNPGKGTTFTIELPLDSSELETY